MPLTLPMLTMDPPSSCACITALAACDTWRGASRFNWRIDSENRGDAVAASAGGAPPALFTTVSSRPPASTAAAHRGGRLVGIAQVGRREHGGRVAVANRLVGLGPGGDDHGGAGPEEALGDASAYALGATGDEHGAAGEVERIGIGRHAPRMLPGW